MSVVIKSVANKRTPVRMLGRGDVYLTTGGVLYMFLGEVPHPSGGPAIRAVRLQDGVVDFYDLDLWVTPVDIEITVL